MITGTNSGFGKATVARFAREGWNVVATVRKEADLTVHAGIPNVKTLLLDVNNEAAAEPFARESIAAFGRVDVLVNNAGYYHMGPVEASSMDQIHEQFQTNVFGLIALTKAFLPSFSWSFSFQNREDHLPQTEGDAAHLECSTRTDGLH